MSDRRTLAARLESIGGTETPPLTDERVAAIEQRIALRAPLPLQRAAPPRPRVRHVWVAAAAVVVLSVLAVVSFGGSSDALRFTAAEGVVVEAPGAVARTVRAGDDVPEGAVVEVAAGGTAAIGRDRFGPGRYVVVAGRLVALSTTTAPAVERSTTTGAVAVPAVPPPSTARDAASSTTAVIERDTAAPSTASSPAATTQATTTAPPTRTAATSPATPAPIPERSTTTATPPARTTTTTVVGRTSTSRGR